MKSKIILVVLFAALCCCTQSHAQSFLENLGQTIKKEIKKEVNEGINNLKETLKDNAKDKAKELNQQEPKQKPQHEQVQEQNQNAPKPVGNPSDVPITKMKTWLLVVKDGKPHYKALDGKSLAKENYILFDVKYEHPDGVALFTEYINRYSKNY